MAAEDGRAALASMTAGGKRALARALSGLEAGLDAPESCALLDAALAAAGGATIGLTGPPGVGKSSLIDALIRSERAAGRRVAVIAVDPSSRKTGGALLGDRTRMSADPEDDGVFIRSLAARDRLGGLSDLAFPSMLLAATAYDLVLVETVGVGQSETEIAGLADATACCLQPGSGDALQFMKAGVMETPDLLLVTKADLGAPARRTAADAAAALSLTAAGQAAPEVMLVAARAPSEDAIADNGVAAAAAAMRRLAVAGSGVARRRDQARLWAQAAIGARFGSEGWRLVCGEISGSDAVFAAAAAAGRRLSSLLGRL
ncbi:MAG: methylmalonyl Co-A mutase-associated GTPase MeaB [Neomegalonema sp.]|nr:methylmalonyl Co-A mutase-associated GTPase MeaB [Neomegalonema sp.]